MESNKMKAARLHRIGEFVVDKIEIPVPHGNELLIRIGACGLCGSDLPRIYEHGTSSGKYPLTIGHEFAGTVVAVGEDADASLIGKRGAVFPLIPCRKCPNCLTEHYAMCEHYDYLGSRSDGGFAEYCLIPDTWHFVPSSNENTPMEVLAMMEPACVAQHAVLRRGGTFAGANVIIFGAGPIGIMAGRWAKLAGAAHVLLVDVVESKAEFARAHGMDATVATGKALVEEIKSFFGGKLADVCVEGTGYGSALENAIFCTKSFGTIVLMGNPAGNTTISLSAHSHLLRQEIDIKGIWNSHFGNSPINEWHYTASMMDNGAFQCDDLISHRVNIDELPEAVEKIHNRELSICKLMYINNFSQR